MEKVGKIKSAIADKGRVVAGKAKDLKDVARLKGQIFTCEEVIRKNIREIGEMVFAEYEERKESEESGESACLEEMQESAGAALRRYEKQCVAIANAKRAIADLRKQIKEIKRK